jgi:hypothetical protein
MSEKLVFGILGLAVIAVVIMAAPDIKRYIRISTM